MKQSWLDKPITWRSYFRLGGIITLVYLMVCGVWTAVTFGEEISEWIRNVAYRVKTGIKNLGRKEVLPKESL